MLPARASLRASWTARPSRPRSTSLFLSHAHVEKKRCAGSEGDAPRSEQKRPWKLAWKRVSWGDTVATDARRQPALHLIFDLNKEEEPEEEEDDDDESAAAPSSSRVAGAAIKRKRTKDKFLVLSMARGP